MPALAVKQATVVLAYLRPPPPPLQVHTCPGRKAGGPVWHCLLRGPPVWGAAGAAAAARHCARCAARPVVGAGAGGVRARVCESVLCVGTCRVWNCVVRGSVTCVGACCVWKRVMYGIVSYVGTCRMWERAYQRACCPAPDGLLNKGEGGREGRAMVGVTLKAAGRCWSCC